jgi:hypothetical protein
MVAALGSAFALGACSSAMNDQKTGETHFLACKKDSDCRSLGDGFYCPVDHCVEDGGAAGTGGGTGSGGTGSSGTGNGGAGNGGSGAGATGNAGAGGSGGDDFAECAQPPPSSCSRAETCAHLDCGGPEFDENGCARAACKADADCGADERCTDVMCITHGGCDTDMGSCMCAFLADCGQGDFCNPVASAGPRGDWVTLEITKTSGPCPTAGACTSHWRVGPDGHVTGDDAGVTVDAKLDPFELMQMKYVANGVELRKGLRDGMSCFQDTVFDLSVSLKLTLSTGDYTKDVSGCISGDGSIASAFRILSKF